MTNNTPAPADLVEAVAKAIDPLRMNAPSDGSIGDAIKSELRMQAQAAITAMQAYMASKGMTQMDRDNLASMYEANAPKYAAEIRSGKHDDTPLLLTFSDHRRAAAIGKVEITEAQSKALHGSLIASCDEFVPPQPTTTEIASQEPVALLHHHPDYPDELEPYNFGAGHITQGDKDAGWTETPLYAALPTTATLMADNARLAEAKSEAWERAQRVKAPEDAEILAICERIGFGAVMDSASRQWILRDPIGAFYIGGCLSKQEPKP